MKTRWKSAVPTLLLVLLGIVSWGGGTCLAGDTEDKLKNLFAVKLDDARVTSNVLGLPGDRFAVELAGEVDTKAEKELLERIANQIKPANVDIRSKLTVKPTAEATALWNLTYISSRVLPTGKQAVQSALAGTAGSGQGAGQSTSGGSGSSGSSGGSTAGSSGSGTATQATSGTGTPGDNIDALVAALNKIYGSAERPAVQRAGVGRLLLQGKRETVMDIQRFMAVIDAPWPQVQLNLWAVQVTGSPEQIAERVDRISEMVQDARDQMAGEVRKLAELAGQEGTPTNAWLKKTFSDDGIDLDPEGPLSLNESLILLMLRDDREERVDKLCGPCAKDCQKFSRLKTVLAKSSVLRDRTGLRRFGRALACFHDEDHRLELPDAPGRLVRASAAVDRLLQSAVEAFSADMNEACLDPLLRDIRRLATPDRRGGGIVLVGRSRIVVTSAIEAGLEPEMVSFAETTRPKPFGKELLDLAFPASESTGAGALTGASKVLAGLSNPQAIALAALLSGDTEPNFSEVAPGIAIHVRPTVVPDGGSARLTIDARFGVESTPLNPGRTDVWAQAPPAGIRSHNVKTDAAVNAFDLFDISSFSVTASHPQAPFYVPILGRLPVLGQAFQFPRRNKETQFESIVLVNTVILPRSLELQRFYSGVGAGTEHKLDLAACQQETPPTPKTSTVAAH